MLAGIFGPYTSTFKSQEFPCSQTLPQPWRFSDCSFAFGGGGGIRGRLLLVDCRLSTSFPSCFALGVPVFNPPSRSVIPRPPHVHQPHHRMSPLEALNSRYNTCLQAQQRLPPLAHLIILASILMFMPPDFSHSLTSSKSQSRQSENLSMTVSPNYKDTEAVPEVATPSASESEASSPLPVNTSPTYTLSKIGRAHV